MAKKNRSELIVGLDIGTTAVRVAVGQATPSLNGETKIMALVEVPSEGIQRGTITSLEELVSCISHALEETERLIGVPVSKVWVGISGHHIITQPTKGVVAVAKSDNEISADDVTRAIDSAKMISPPLNYEVLNVLPRSFTVDGEPGIRDPVGMTGIRLEVDASIICALQSHVKNLTKAVYRSGVDIEDLAVSLFATVESVTTERQREMGVAVVDLGGASTSLAVYEGGDLLYSSFLPLGSMHVTNDLAIGLRTTIEVAETVKLKYGHCRPQEFRSLDLINLADAGATEPEEISRKYIAEIVEARVSEILEKVNDDLVRIDRDGRLPSGVVFVGAGAKIDGLIPLAKDLLRLPAVLGYPLFTSGSTEKVNDLAFVPAVGLVRWGGSDRVGARPRAMAGFGNKFSESLQKIFKTLLP